LHGIKRGTQHFTTINNTPPFTVLSILKSSPQFSRMLLIKKWLTHIAAQILSDVKKGAEFVKRSHFLLVLKI